MYFLLKYNIVYTLNANWSADVLYTVETTQYTYYNTVDVDTWTRGGA